MNIREIHAERMKIILRLLRSGEQALYTLAREIDAPEATVRRLIQELRYDGYNIAFAARNGNYVMREGY